MPSRPWSNVTRPGSDIYADADNVFHLVLRAFPATAPFAHAPGETTWSLLMNEVDRQSIRLYAACLMPDHLHVLASPMYKPIPSWVNGFKGHVVRTIRAQTGTRAVWQPRYYDRLVRTEAEMRDVVAYIGTNPVTAGLCSELSDWPWTYISPDL